MTKKRGIIRSASSRFAKRIQASGRCSLTDFFHVVGVRAARHPCLGDLEIVDGEGVLRSFVRAGDQAFEERGPLDL